MMYEQELYQDFKMQMPRTYFATFAGDVSSPFGKKNPVF